MTLIATVVQVSAKGPAFEGYSSAIISNGCGGDVLDMLDLNDITQLLDSLGISTVHKLVLKGTFASWKKNPDTAFEALASAQVRHVHPFVRASDELIFRKLRKRLFWPTRFVL
jgi:hypothetical protein